MKFRTLSQKFFYLAMTFSLVAGSGSAGADDTEIYFSTGSSSGNVSDPLRPNVLFILDTSGSMTDTVPDTGGKSRITVLKEAMTTIIDNVEDINLGLMRFTNNDGGPVLYPIKYIDLENREVVGEPDDSQQSYTIKVSTGDDDGVEDNTSHAVTLTDATLKITESAAVAGGSTSLNIGVSTDNDDAEEEKDGDINRGSTDLDILQYSSNNDTKYSAVRFQNIAVPRNASITSAYLDFWHRDNSSGSITVDVKVQNTDNASSISSNDDDISSRSYLSTAVSWAIPSGSAGTQVSSTSPDVTTLVQSIVNRSGWNSGQAMLFSLRRTSGSGTRNLRTRDGTSSEQPHLRITYGTAASAAVRICAL